MDFRRNGSRDERRRRVLMEDAQVESVATDETESPPVKRQRSKNAEGAPTAKRYPPASLANGQPRIADLLPKRRLTLWLWIIAAGCLISALTALDLNRDFAQARFPTISFSAFELGSAGSLARWLSSIIFVWAAFASIQVYVIRRHRNDDYRGGYRLWLWTACILLLASVDVNTSLHHLVGELLALFVQSPGHSRHLGFVVAGVGGGFVALRMLWEIKASRGSLAALVFAIGCYCTSMVLSFSTLIEAPRNITLAWAAALSAHSFVLISIGCFGRYILLEAKGELVERRRKTKETVTGAPARRKNTDKAKESAPNAIDSGADRKKRVAKSDLGDSTEAAKPAKIVAVERSSNNATEPSKVAGNVKSTIPTSPPKSAVRTVANVNDDDDDDDNDDSQPLSKSERRKLRKQKKLNSRAA